MNKKTEALREKLAEQLHQMQVESAQYNDAHTEGISVFYLEWQELHDEMKEWYRKKAILILQAFKEAGGVFLDDQPIITHPCHICEYYGRGEDERGEYASCSQPTCEKSSRWKLNANFKRVEEIEG